jgi:hypothetical protein
MMVGGERSPKVHRKSGGASQEENVCEEFNEFLEKHGLPSNEPSSAL